MINIVTSGSNPIDILTPDDGDGSSSFPRAGSSPPLGASMGSFPVQDKIPWAYILATLFFIPLPSPPSARSSFSSSLLSSRS